jgi:hypothetical protein
MDTLMDSIGRNILHVAAACGNNFGVALAVRSKMDVRKEKMKHSKSIHYFSRCSSFSSPPLFFFPCHLAHL